jgi:hypothetical protein
LEGSLKVVGTGMNITEQEQLTVELRRSERDLHERESELRQILDLTPQHMLRDIVGIDQVLFGTDFPYLRRDLAVKAKNGS